MIGRRGKMAWCPSLCVLRHRGTLLCTMVQGTYLNVSEAEG